MLGCEEMIIIPSSIHELIGTPAGLAEPEDLAAMIQEVNTTTVAQEEQLSDHPYLYDGHSLQNIVIQTRIEQREGRSR